MDFQENVEDGDYDISESPSDDEVSIERFKHLMCRKYFYFQMKIA